MPRSEAPEPDELETVEPDTEPTAKGKAGGRATGKPRAVSTAAAKRTGRTVYITDDLWERVIVQAHRRRLTCSDYICSVLGRNVPDHRRVGADQGEAQSG